jgi:adenosine deaminase
MSPTELADLPKVELHTHLDCALSYELMRRLSPDISPGEFRARFRAPLRCASLTEFLAAIAPSLDLLQTRRALRLAAADLAAQLQADNVIYAEVRFAPLLHIRDGLRPEEIVESVLEGFGEAKLQVGLILCTLRHFSTEQGSATLDVARRHRRHGVVGFDLAGDELNFPIDPHVPVFARAHDLGIAVTAHAGEARGAESVVETMEKLRPRRIGHGVRSIDDRRAMELILERGIHMEVCPSVNIQIGLFPTMAEHPVDRLRRFGISVGVNTDARTTTGVTLTQEYALIARTFGWTRTDFIAVARAALEASFAGEDVKGRMRVRLEAAAGAIT